MRWFRIFTVFALLLPASFAWAESEAIEDDRDERVDQVESERQAIRREAATIDRKTRQLEIRRETLEEDLRVGDPFRSRRALRNELRATESRGQWYKHENLRNDFSIRRNERNLRRLRRSRPRG
jgi:hypothetical protein